MAGDFLDFLDSVDGKAGFLLDLGKLLLWDLAHFRQNFTNCYFNLKPLLELVFPQTRPDPSRAGYIEGS